MPEPRETGRGRSVDPYEGGPMEGGYANKQGGGGRRDETLQPTRQVGARGRGGSYDLPGQEKPLGLPKKDA